MNNNSLRKNKVLNLIVIFALFFLQSNFSYALPNGAYTVNGQTVISYNGKILNITASNGSIINWNYFGSDADEAINFFQPNSSATVLNRVIGIDPSYLLGALNANGRVFIVNPNGVFFGKGSQVNVNGLLASTLDISNSDFIAGKYNFTQNGKPAWIINQGRIIANGGYVVLLSNAINNSGLIEARLGRVLLAAGEKMTVALDDNSDICVTINDAVSHNVFGPDGAKIAQAIENSGSIHADGGMILLNAKMLNGIFDNAVNNDGVIQANSLVNNNGTIEIKADGGDITSTSGSVISAKASDSTAQGGSITLNSTNNTNIQNGAVIDVSGGSLSGDAGSVDISAQGDVNFAGTLNGQAADGYNLGNFTIDPTNANISGFVLGNTTVWAKNNITITGDVYDVLGGTLNLYADHTSSAANAWDDGVGTITRSGNYTIYGGLIPANLNLEAGSGIGSLTSAIQISDMGNVSAQINPTAGTGGIYVKNTGSLRNLNISSASTNGGDINLSSTNTGVTFAGAVNAGSGNVTVNAKTDINQTAGTIVAQGAELIAGGNVTTPNLSVSNLAVNAGGDAVITNSKASGLTVNTVGATSGIKAKDLNLTALVGDININSGIKVTNNATLTSSNGSIKGNGNASNPDITANNLNLSAAKSIWGSSAIFNSLHTVANSISATALSGYLEISNTNAAGVNLNSLKAGNNIYFDQVGGDIRLGNITTPQDVYLSANDGAIVNNNGTNNNVTANHLLMGAQNGIGAAGAINTKVSYLSVRNVNNDININNTGDLSLSNFSVMFPLWGLGSITYSAYNGNGGINIASTSSLSVDDAVNAYGPITLRSGAFSNLTVNADVQSTGNGDILFFSGNDYLQTAGNVSTGNSILIDAGNNITQTAGSLTAVGIDLTAGGSITVPGLNVSDTLDFYANGNVNITNVGALNVYQGNSNNHDITITAGGNLDLLDVNVGSGNLYLTSLNGSIVGMSGDDITANSAYLHAAQSIYGNDSLTTYYNNETNNFLTINAGTVKAVANNAIDIYDSGSVNLTAGVTGVGGSIDVVSQGDMLVNSVTGSNNVTLESTGGSMIGKGVASHPDITANNLYLYAANSIFGVNKYFTSTLFTLANSISARASSGYLEIANTSAAGVNLNSLYAGSNILFDQNRGDIRLGNITTPGDVYLSTYGGAIINNNGASNNITANHLFIMATSGIGSANAINTQVSYLSARNESNDVNISNTGDLSLSTFWVTFPSFSLGTSVGSVLNSNGGVNISTTSALSVDSSVTAGGLITLASGAGLTVNADVTSLGNGKISLNSGSNYLQTAGNVLTGGDVLINAANNITQTGGTLTANGAELIAGGDISLPNLIVSKLAIHSGGDVTITNNNAGGLTVGTVGLTSGITAKDLNLTEIVGDIDINNGINVTNNATLTAGHGSIAGNGDSTNPDITANNLYLYAANSILNQFLNGSLYTAANSISATASAGYLEISNTNAGGVDLNSLRARNNISFIQNGGDIRLGNISTLNDVVLFASSGGVINNNGSSNNISADHLFLIAQNGIGSSGALNTKVSYLMAYNIGSQGDINISNTGTLTLSDFSISFPGGLLWQAFGGGTYNSGNINISTTSSLSVNYGITSGGILTLTSGAHSDLTINADIVSTGNIIFNSGHDYLQTSGNVLSYGNVLVNAKNNINQIAGSLGAAVGVELVAGGSVTVPGLFANKLAVNANGDVNITNVGALAIDTVGSTSGVTSNNHDIIINTGNTLTLNQDINAGTGTVDLTAIYGGVSNTNNVGIIADTLNLYGKGVFSLFGTDNKVGTLTANIAGLLFFMQKGVDLNLGSIVSGGGDVDVSVSSASLTLSGIVNAGTGTVDLIAGSIIGAAGSEIIADTTDLLADSIYGSYIPTGLQYASNAGGFGFLMVDTSNLTVYAADRLNLYDSRKTGLVVQDVETGGSTNPSPSVYIVSAGDMNVGYVFAGTVTLETQNGSIIGQNTSTEIAANNLYLYAQGSIYNNMPSPRFIDPFLHTSANSITAKAATGFIYIRNSNFTGVNLNSLNAAGDILFQQDGGDIRLGNITTSQDVYLDAPSGAIVNSSGTNNITANHLVLQAGSGIGSSRAISTEVSYLNVSNNNGDININNTGALVLSGFTMFTPLLSYSELYFYGVNNPNGGVNISATSSLTVANAIYANGPITLTSGASADLTISADVQSMGNGKITFNSGHDYLQTAGIVSTGGDLLINADNNINQAAGLVSTCGVGGPCSSTIFLPGTGPVGSLIANNAELIAGGSVTVPGLNANKLAVNAHGDINITNVGALAIDTVGATSGVTSHNHNVTLKTGSTLTLNQNINAGSATVILNATGGATETNGAIIANSLLLMGSGIFDLFNSNNNVAMIAANINGSLTYLDSDALTVGSVDGIAGITTNNNLVELITHDTLTLNNNVNAGAERVFFGIYAGGVNQTGGMITANSLLLLGNGDFSLTSATNSVGRIVARINGSLSYTDANALTVSSITTNSHNVTLNTGALVLNGDIDAGSATVRLTANGGVSNTGNAGVIANNLLLSGTGSFVLIGSDNNVTNLVAAITGPLTYTQTGALNIGITSGNNDVTVNAGSLTLTDNVNAGSGNVNLNATAGSISDVNDSTVTGNILDFSAITGIGVGFSALKTVGNTITATTTNGDINLMNTNASATTVASLTTGNGDIVFTQSGGDLTLGSVSTNNGSITVDATGNIIAGNPGDTTPYNLVARAITLIARNGSIGSLLNPIVTFSELLDITTGANAYLNSTGVEIHSLNALGTVVLNITNGAILDQVQTGGDFTLDALTGDITLNGTIQSTGGAVNLLSSNGNINANVGSTVIANGNSHFSTPNGTIGLINPVNVNINGNLILNIGTRVGLNSGFLTGTVTSSPGIPLFDPTSFPSPLYPPGNVFFNGQRIWPSASTFLLSQAASSALGHFVFPAPEKLALSQINTFDPTSSSNQTGGVGGLFLYHPLTNVDSGAFDQEFQLDQGAYDFIDGQILKKP